MKNNRRNQKLTPKQIRKIVLIAVIAAAVIVGIVLYLRKKVSDTYGMTNETEVSSASVTRGSISTSVSGSGRLSDDDAEQLDIPSGVELEEIYVSLGDKVEEGDILASVKMSSVLSAMSTVSEEISSLDSQISTAASSGTSSTITSQVSGRVKKVYAEAGDTVADLMYENGALALVSLDGYMAVDIENDTLAAGDSVTVTTSAGKTYTGKVSENILGTATILVTDNGTTYGDTVTVSDSDGSELGSGTLTIHDELQIVGYTGTVSRVSVNENSAVYSGSTILTLTDTANTASYQSLLSQREDKQETMQELIRIYKEGALYSTLSGTVKQISAVTGSTDSEQSFGISPDSTMSMTVNVDETDILSISTGQSAVVSVDSISGETFPGTVTAIDKIGTSSGGVTTYTATITISKTDSMLSGMSASATITIEGVEDALLIPADALNKTSSTYYVYTSYDESTGELGGMTEVTVGVTNSNYAEITDGLSEGDTVYYTAKQSDSFDFGSMDFGGGMSFDAGSMPQGGDLGGGSGGGGPQGGDFGGGGFPG